MPLFERIDASQPDIWHSVFHSAKEVLVTSFKILDIRRCVRDGFLRTSQSNTKPTELLAGFEAKGETFLSWIVTADETWVHHFELETKSQSMEWHHPQSLWNKKKKKTLSVGKVIITVFWDCE
jgi:hypothetical protein